MLAQSDWTGQVKTRTGVTLNIRAASPADWEDILVFLRTVELGDLRYRFLSAVKPSEALAHLLANVDHHSREDLIAFDARDGSIAATAMIAQGSAPDCAEIAVLVRSDLKNQGIGWEMLGKACDYAHSRGYKRVECVESSSNQRAIALEREQGFASQFHAAHSDLTVLTKVLA